MKHATLCDRLDAAADQLTDEVLGEMYKNPFWYERYGERATIHGRKDGRFHIDYLKQALASGDAAVMEHYARWLQQLLTARGMCSRHIAENFDRLAAAITAREWDDGNIAVSMLAAATHALLYPAGPARTLQDRRTQLASAVADALTSRHPAWSTVHDDLATHVDYAADALALGSSATFLAHVTWSEGFFARRDIALREHLVGLREAPGATAELCALLDEALAQLRSS